MSKNNRFDNNQQLAVILFCQNKKQITIITFFIHNYAIRWIILSWIHFILFIIKRWNDGKKLLFLCLTFYIDIICVQEK